MVYREEGRSARHDSIRKRPTFKLMLDDSTKRTFDIALVHTLDGLSRNMKVMLEAITFLETSNIGLVLRPLCR